LAPEKSPEGTLPQLDQLLPEFQLPENFSLNQKIDGGAVHNREMLVHKITGGEWEFYFPKNPVVSARGCHKSAARGACGPSGEHWHSRAGFSKSEIVSPDLAGMRFNIRQGFGPGFFPVWRLGSTDRGLW
jgi:hypothetical protein